MRGDLRLLLDYKLSLEYRDVALRSEHIRASKMTERGIVEMIEALEELAEPVEVLRQIRPLSSDPNDDMVLDVAINGRADVIVTQNLKHFVVARQFGIRVLKPGELVEEWKGETQHGR
jgi:predicted nucleic acid-binding protein